MSLNSWIFINLLVVFVLSGCGGSGGARRARRDLEYGKYSPFGGRDEPAGSTDEVEARLVVDRATRRDNYLKNDFKDESHIINNENDLDAQNRIVSDDSGMKGRPKRDHRPGRMKSSILEGASDEHE